jgi:hypothetical protein
LLVQQICNILDEQAILTLKVRRQVITYIVKVILGIFHFVIRPNATREINTASTCTVGNLVIRSNASKVNVALISSYTLQLDVYDTWGNLSVHGAAGFMNINKSAWGNMTVSGLAGATNLQHTGRTGNINFKGAAAVLYCYPKCVMGRTF